MEISIIIALIAAVLTAAGGFIVGKKNSTPQDISPEKLDALLKQKKSTALLEVEKEVQDIKANAQKKANEVSEEAESRAQKIRKDMAEQETLILEREKTLNDRSKMIEERVLQNDKIAEDLKVKAEELSNSGEKLQAELEKVAQLTVDEAKQKLMEQVDQEMVGYKAKSIRQAEQEAKEGVEEKSQKILIESMQRVVTDYVGETTTSTIKIEDEKVKGRVIGKQGRNIRAFEKATGVDVDIDESDSSIGLSSFDPLRRAIASKALEKLVKDGRIHPSSIEDEVRKAKNEIASEIKENGQILADEANWPGMDMGLLKLVGKLKYRTSYGQSMMSHTVEVIRMGAVLAAEVGADIDLVKKACLLHDIGKVLTHKVEGAHHHISGQIARKYNLPDKLVNAIEAHHLDIEPQSIEAWLVHMADAISGARPGARKESFEDFIKRMEGLENTAKEVAGNKADDVFAIQAGRELRVIVKPRSTSDDDIVVLAKEIADAIHDTQTYPGTVKVNVIREVRAQETAM